MKRFATVSVNNNKIPIDGGEAPEEEKGDESGASQVKPANAAALRDRRLESWKSPKAGVE